MSLISPLRQKSKQPSSQPSTLLSPGLVSPSPPTPLSLPSLSKADFPRTSSLPSSLTGGPGVPVKACSVFLSKELLSRYSSLRTFLRRIGKRRSSSSNPFDERPRDISLATNDLSSTSRGRTRKLRCTTLSSIKHNGPCRRGELSPSWLLPSRRRRSRRREFYDGP